MITPNINDNEIEEKYLLYIALRGFVPVLIHFPYPKSYSGDQYYIWHRVENRKPLVNPIDGVPKLLTITEMYTAIMTGEVYE